MASSILEEQFDQKHIFFWPYPSIQVNFMIFSLNNSHPNQIHTINALFWVDLGPIV
jgi:hypothetical protein